MYIVRLKRHLLLLGFLVAGPSLVVGGGVGFLLKVGGSGLPDQHLRGPGVGENLQKKIRLG